MWQGLASLGVAGLGLTSRGLAEGLVCGFASLVRVREGCLAAARVGEGVRRPSDAARVAALVTLPS